MDNSTNKLLDEMFKILKKGKKISSDDNHHITHYSSFDTGINILSSKVLRATDFRYLNDPLEIDYAIDKIKSVLDRYIKTNPELETVLSMLTQKWEKDQYHMLITSFVMREDYLPGWRYYGEDGKGLAISFKKDLIIKRFENRNVMTVHVIYENDCQTSLIEDLVSCYIKKGNHQSQVLTSILFLCLPIFKSSDWKDELEVRLVSPHIYMEQDQKYIYSDLPKDKIVKHCAKLQYQLFDFEYYEIEKVTVGPSANYSNVKNTIITEMLKIGVDRIPFKIEQSKIGYNSK